MGRVGLIADNHFYREKMSGDIYVSTMYSYQYFLRFIESFNDFVVIARGTEVPSCEQRNLLKANGDGVDFWFVDDFNGLKELLSKRGLIKKQLKEYIEKCDVVIVRMPCILTEMALKEIRRAKKPFILDVGADPETIYLSDNASAFDRIFSKYMKNMCKKACMDANGVSYVTNYVLQNKYPCKAIIDGETDKYFTAAISNVNIKPDYINKPQVFNTQDGVNIIHVSTNIPQASGKGHQEAIKIMQLLKQKGIKARLSFVGDGDGVADLKLLAKNLSVDENVYFLGRFSSPQDVKDQLNKSDIFLFPSHSEGLPRALIEAMATGLVCIASNVDGIPELLHEEDIFEYSDIEGMATRIKFYVENNKEMENASRRNVAVASNYTIDKLSVTYRSFYSKINGLMN